ncbi:MAG: hypothetical protein SGILL_001894 [Bacillariaceae sp.]
MERKGLSVDISVERNGLSDRKPAAQKTTPADGTEELTETESNGEAKKDPLVEKDSTTESTGEAEAPAVAKESPKESTREAEVPSLAEECSNQSTGEETHEVEVPSVGRAGSDEEDKVARDYSEPTGSNLSEGELTDSDSNEASPHEERRDGELARNTQSRPEYPFQAADGCHWITRGPFLYHVGTSDDGASDYAIGKVYARDGHRLIYDYYAPMVYDTHPLARFYERSVWKRQLENVLQYGTVRWNNRANPDGFKITLDGITLVIMFYQPDSPRENIVKTVLIENDRGRRTARDLGRPVLSDGEDYTFMSICEAHYKAEKAREEADGKRIQNGADVSVPNVRDKPFFVSSAATNATVYRTKDEYKRQVQTMVRREQREDENDRPNKRQRN